MSDLPWPMTKAALDEALCEHGLEEAFGRLSESDRRLLGGWVEEARSEEEISYRVGALVRILHVSKRLSETAGPYCTPVPLIFTPKD